MFRHAALIAAIVFALPATAQEGGDGVVITETPEGAEALATAAPELVITEAGTQALDDFMWRARPLVVFADSPSDPRFLQQMEYLAADPEALIARDVVVITDSDPAAKSPIREELRPRGFDLVLLGKDGFKYLRKPMPWKVREITRSIDKMPLRQQELKDLRGK